MKENHSNSKLNKYLTIIDIFQYVPVPQAFPVSTIKSKIGSIIFICLLIGYLIYDFYSFLTDNIPSMNAYSLSTLN
jgi:uncharacterized protein with PQ loop repeat